MPPLPLAKILDVALPSLAGEARAVVNVLACKNGLLPPAGDVATFLGLRTRHQVARTLRRASLPPLEELAAWTRLFYWVLQSEQTGASLLALARQSRLEPATCYRLVRRLMGQPWSQVRRGGIAGAILRFRTIRGDTGIHALVLQPYVVAADVYAVSPHTGRGGWTWYTGSASWLYRVGLESILGFHRRGARLFFEPCVPAGWGASRPGELGGDGEPAFESSE